MKPKYRIGDAVTCHTNHQAGVIQGLWVDSIGIWYRIKGIKYGIREHNLKRLVF